MKYDMILKELKRDRSTF